MVRLIVPAIGALISVVTAICKIEMNLAISWFVVSLPFICSLFLAIGEDIGDILDIFNN